MSGSQTPGGGVTGAAEAAGPASPGKARGGSSASVGEDPTLARGVRVTRCTRGWVSGGCKTVGSAGSDVPGETASLLGMARGPTTPTEPGCTSGTGALCGGWRGPPAAPTRSATARWAQKKSWSEIGAAGGAGDGTCRAGPVDGPLAGSMPIEAPVPGSRARAALSSWVLHRCISPSDARIDPFPPAPTRHGELGTVHDDGCMLRACSSDPQMLQACTNVQGVRLHGLPLL